MSTIGGEERALTGHIFENSLALKEIDSQVYRDAFLEVKQLSEQGDIYPPDVIPNTSFPEVRSSLRTRLLDSSFLDGRLSPAEAIAVKFLMEEAAALSQAPVTERNREKFHTVMHLSKDAWFSDAIDGFSEFGTRIGYAAGVRDRVLDGSGEPKGTILKNHAQRLQWKNLNNHIKSDGNILEINTANAIVAKITDEARRNITDAPGGARTQNEITARIESKIHGAKLAQRLYLEVLAHASKHVSTEVIKRI